MKLPGWISHPFLAVISSRVLIFFIGFVSPIFFPAEGGHWVSSPESPFLSMWARWDSQFYADIATNGYWYQPGHQSNVAFFPFYPLLMRVVGNFLGNDVILAGFIISNVAFFGALIFFYKLTELNLDSGSASRAVYYLAFFPTSFFFSSVYTESIFLLFLFAAVYFAQKHNWILAAFLGIITAVTRNIGILAWPLVINEWLKFQGWSLKGIFRADNWSALMAGFKKNWFDLIIISIIPLGLFAYMFFLKNNFDQPFAFLDAQSAWGRVNIGPLGVISKAVQDILSFQVSKGWLANFWNTGTFLIFITLVPFIWFKIDEGYAVFVFIALFLPSSSAMGSMIRYVLTAFPAFMMLASWGRHEIVNKVILLSFSFLLSFFVFIYTIWIFVA